MKIKFLCPFCRKCVAADDEDCGQGIACGCCYEIINVPRGRFDYGVVIGDCLILDQIEKDEKTGIVCLACQLQFSREVVLYAVPIQTPQNPVAAATFIKSCIASAKLNHPNLVRAYAIGEEDGIFFMAAERAEGVTLDKLLKQKKMVSAQEAVQVTLAVASVIDCAWNEQRLVLRNISPRNIAITGSGMVKVTNLRFARIAEDLEDLNEDLNIWDPQYCSSPESLNGTPMDVRSDIYGLGATFFHLVTGRLPFEGDTAFEIARKHLQEPVPDPRDLNPDLPESFTRIIQKMMAKDMKERYQDAAELIADIRLSRRQKETEKTDGAVSVKTQRIEKVERTLELRVPEHRERSEPLPAGRACFFAGSFEETVRADNLLHVPSGFRNQLLPGDELVLAMSKDNLLVMPGGNAFIPDLKEGGIPFEIVTIAPDYGFPVSLPEAPSFKMGQRVVFLGAVTHFMAMASKSGNQ